MAATFSLMTAALLVAQSPATPTAPSTCPCQKNNNNVSQVQYIQPVPANVAPGSGYVTSAPAPAADNHPILTRIRSFFRGSDASAEASATVINSEPPVEQKRLWRPLPTTTITTPIVVTPVGAPVTSPSIQAIPNAPTALPAAPVKIVTPISSPSIPSTSTPVNSSMIATPTSPLSPVSMTTPATTVTRIPSGPSKISPDLLNKVGHADDFTWITGQVRIEKGVHVLHYATPETVDRYNGHVVLNSDKDLRSVPEGAYVCVRGNVAQTAGNQTIYRVQALDILTASR